MRRVIIAQSIRLFFLVAALPLVISSLSLAPPPVTTTPGGVLWEMALVLAVGAAAALLLERLKVPAGLFIGAIFVSASFYLGGIAHGALPSPVVIFANVVLGTSLASRFQDFSLGELARCLGDGLAGFAIALLIATAGAILTSHLAQLPLAMTLVAFSPGGLDAMLVMALALNLDPAYVGAHQLVRYVAMSLVIPPLSAYVLRPRLPPPSPPPGP